MSGEAGFTFHETAPIQLSSELNARLEKWDLALTSKILRFRFDEPYEAAGPRSASSFVADLFNSQAFRQSGGTMLLTNRRSSWGLLSSRVSEVKLQPLLSTSTSMDFFDRLFASGVVDGKTNSIKKCFEDYIDNIPVGDELRKVF
jgi:hypothetical protein